jgi:hypothetical protein
MRRAAAGRDHVSMRIAVIVAACVLLLVVPAWAAVRLGGEDRARVIPAIDVGPSTATVPAPDDGGFRAAPSRAHRAGDCDDDGELEFDDDDCDEADDDGDDAFDDPLGEALDDASDAEPDDADDRAPSAADARD